MPEPTRIEDLRAALDQRLFPTVGLWNRLEGRPRTTSFERALRAEVRDPLWMLTRQWQLGEFRGTDAGSPVTATYSVATSVPSRFRPGSGAAGTLPTEALPADRPLEAVAERRALPFAFGPDPVSYDLRLIIGRRWLKLLGPQLGLKHLRPTFIEKYRIALPEPAVDADTPRTADQQVWSTLQAFADRRMDGYALYRHIKADNGKASDGISVSGPARAQLDGLGARLVAWFDDLFDQPGGDATWDATRLEHRFSIAAAPTGTEKVLTAQEFPGGHLDWHAFSVDPGTPLGGTTPPPAPLNRTVFPAPVRYSGMPLPRWWAVEDGRTNFAGVRPDSTDLAKLVFLEFALVYSNDWYQLPCDLPAGVLASIQGLAVTDVFGQRQWISPAGSGQDEDWQRWSMYTLDTIGTADVPADLSFFLPPTVPKVAEGAPLEEIALIRDENANMVWGVEKTVPLPTGEGRRGSEVVAEILAHRRRFVPTPAPDAPRAPIAYQAMSVVPENWVPFVAVHVPDSDRAIRLQRAAMLSVIDGKPVRPHTSLLREGIDAGNPYFVNEEEVPPTGTTLALAYRRTRWYNGRVSVWLGAQRGVGRGEGSSGLVFDTLVDTAHP
ncbi:hypothetical protein BX285_6423 [Streptomyces sp. 1114.5]|uniref:hypothetical protein n=1 Tax=Streptomyces sp. 1114.5 TaxID=1938830 RepID=UPI000EB0D6D2|nr:hypothetical protein [Streptomyces sp. 1114.5]RKT09336.1 hypothetical protein BX285_6423 [Streptomyces sp. 1114.5]